MKFYNIVFCTHSTTRKRYIFELPLSAEVSEGDHLAATTAEGFADDLTAFTDNMMVSEGTAHALTRVVNGTWPLKRIESKVKKEMRPVTVYERFDGGGVQVYPDDVELPY